MGGEIVNELLNHYLADLKLEGKRPQTLSTYARRLQTYVQWLAATDTAWDQLDHAGIERYKRYLQRTGHQATTVKAHLATLSSLYQWAQRQGYVATVPVSKLDYPPIRPQRLHRLTDEQLLTFAAYIDHLQVNLRAAFWCLLGTGARVGEVAHLTKPDISLKGGAVYVQIQDAKWGSDRSIPIMHPQAARVVWDFAQSLDVDNAPLFRVSKRTLQWYATQFSQQTGIPLHCHLLRHTFAAKLTEQGVPLTTVQYLLGHRSVGMTAYYAQSALVDLDALTPKI